MHLSACSPSQTATPLLVGVNGPQQDCSKLELIEHTVLTATVLEPMMMMP